MLVSINILILNIGKPARNHYAPLVPYTSNPDSPKDQLYGDGNGMGNCRVACT
jgi:hypothetical protein